MIRIIQLNFFICLLAFDALGQTTTLQSANEAFSKQDWKTAISLYQKHLKTTTKDSAAFFNLGIALYKSQQYEASVTALKKAVQHKFNPLRVSYHQAKVQVFMKKPKEATLWAN